MMKLIRFFSIWFLISFSQVAWSDLTIEITEGAEGALPIAIVPFKWIGEAGQFPPHDVSAVITADLKRSGRFNPLSTSKMLAMPATGDEVDFRDWRALAMENIVV